MPNLRKGPTADAMPASGEAPLHTLASGSPFRPRWTLKHNDTFAVFDSHGDIGATDGGPDGLFFGDTRFLSRLELLINGTPPVLLGSAIRDDNLNFHVDLANPDIYADGEIVLAKETVHIARTIFLIDGSSRERIALTNHGEQEVELTLSLTFASDFADIFEVRGARRKRRGRTWRRVSSPGRVVLSYRGLDGALRETTLSFEPPPALQTESVATYSLRVAPGGRRTIFVSVSSRQRLPGSTISFFKGLAAVHRQRRAVTSAVASVETGNDVLNEIFCRSMADLHMLITATEDGPYPYAGIPWYSTTFGRDGIISAMQMLWADPGIAKGVLRRLARYQAKVEDGHADATPGKILHEMRGGEMSALGEVPFGLYYGSIDATPLFIMLAGLYAQRTGDYGLVREIWPAVERALAWIDRWGDVDGDGFIEYARGAETGLANQGWKDSYDAIFHADGRLAEGPIALVEVQGYVYAAKRLAAACAHKLGLAEHAAALQQQAEVLRVRFEHAFWCEDIGTYALALDGAKRPCKVRTSNAGQVLASGIARADRARCVAQGLLQTRFNSGWGIRTVAAGEARYNPMSYHNGSIWPHDNALVAQGFARYGCKEGVNLIFDALVRAAICMDQRRIPELYCGFRRRRGCGPTAYPAACAPQAWAAGAPFLVLQAMLGLEFDPEGRRILLVNPCLPSFASKVTIRNLTLGEASADIVVRQDGDAVSLQMLRTAGDLHAALVFDANM